jgi:hypothetical protein
MSRIRKLVGVAVIAACGPEGPSPPAELEEICGTVGPHRLLALDEAEWLFGVRKIGERLYFLAGEGEGEALFLPRPATSTVYSTGPCGEDPVTVAEGVWSVYEHPGLPGVVSGCTEDVGGALVALDPSGVTAPKMIAAGACLASWTDHGLVRVEFSDNETGQLLFFPYSADPADWPIEPVVLLDAFNPGVASPSPEIFADEVLALDFADNIVRVSLPDGEVTIVQSGVLDFEASERWLLWADRASASGDPERPEADIILRDRQTGEESVIGHGEFGRSWPQLHDESVLMTGAGTPEVVVLPSRRAVTLPEGTRPLYVLEDGRWLLGSSLLDGPFYLFDPSTEVATLLTDDPRLHGYGPEWVTTLRGDTDDRRSEGELWRHPYDGAPELLARRASRNTTLLPDGVVTLLDIGEQELGRLMLVGGELEERAIDDHVRAGLVRSGPPFTEPDTVLYTVQDGERSGVWVARPGGE